MSPNPKDVEPGEAPRSSGGDPQTPEPELGRALKAAVIAWLVLLGTAAVVVGGHDTTVGREIAVRLTGTAVLAAGVVLLAGAVGLRRGHPQGEALATVAALLGAALGGITFIAQAVNDDPDSRLFIWGAIIVTSLVAWRLIRSGMSAEERARGVFSRLPILKSAVSVGLLFSIAQFWYTAIYLPTKAPVSVTIEPHFEPPERRGDRYILRGHVTVENTSSARVVVLASSLVLSTLKVARTPVVDKYRDAVHEADAGELDMASRYPEVQPPDTVSRGRFVTEGFFFEPGETFTRPFIAWALATRDNRPYDIARLELELAIARPTVEVSAEVETVETKTPEQGTVVTRRVPEDGWLQSLTRGDRYIVATYFDASWEANNNFDAVDIGFDRRRSTDPPDDFSERMSRFYGVGYVSGSAAVPLGAPPGK